MSAPMATTNQSINVDVNPITVVVGSQLDSSEQRFFIHSAILEKSSEFFRAALKPRWFSGQQNEVKRPEDDPKMFKFYAEWLYTGKVQRLEYFDLAQLYVLGEKLIDSTFQDTIINAIVAKSRTKDKHGKTWDPGQGIIAYLYENTPQGSPIRQLMVDFYLTNGGPGRMKDGPAPFRKDFLFELATTLLHVREDSKYGKEARKQIHKGVPCAYHKHAADNPCKEEVMTKLLEG